MRGTDRMAAQSANSLWRLVLGHPVHWFAFGFGAGLLPRAPGTWGSALAVLFFWLLPPLPPAVFLSLLAGGFLGGIWLCQASARRLGVHDHPGIVWDEIIGMLATLAVTPRQIGWSLVAFGCFRAMDISKPWPIRDIDHRLRGGLGIMLDDALAAAYAAVIVLGLRELFTRLFS
jgi:phosphatidylglycerophosphatase A